MIFHFSVRRWKGRLRFLLLFASFTIALYHVLLIITSWIEPEYRHRHPEGRAVKVLLQHEGEVVAENSTAIERLKLFYRIGE